MPRATEAYKGGYRMTGGSDANDIDKLLGTLSVLLDQAGTTTSLLSSIVNADGNLAVHVTDATHTGTLLQGTTPWMHNFQGASLGSNLFIGISAGNFTLGAGSDYNVGVGDGALQRITLGAVDNVAVGYMAGNYMTTGAMNTLIGMDAGRCITTAQENTVVGQDCYLNFITGNYNVCIGGDTGYYRIKGDNNTEVGVDAGWNHCLSSSNVRIGFGSGGGPLLQDLGLTPSATGGSIPNGKYWYIVTAVDALREKIIGYIALESGHTTVPGTGNTGSVVLTWTVPTYMTPTSYKVYRSPVGSFTFPASSLISSSATSPYTDTAAAPSAGTPPACTNNTISIGSYALRYNIADSNVAIGSTALTNNTTGYANCAIGDSALYTNTTGVRNIAIGDGALYTANNNYNIAIGINALNKDTSGTGNLAIGYAALRDPTTGSENIGIGFEAGMTATGSDNTLIGYFVAGAVGAQWTALTTGSQNTFIGAQAGILNTAAGSVANSIAIGYQARVTASNQVMIGNASNTDFHLAFLPGIYANNAAAIAGGLTSGSFYRSGADPDVLCIVHPAP